MSDEAAAPETVDPFGNFTGETLDPVPGVDMEYSAATGELSFMPAEEDGLEDVADAEPDVPNVGTNEPESGTDGGSDWEARFKGLQAKMTPTFQELAELKREVAAIRDERNQTKIETASREQNTEIRSALLAAYEQLEGDMSSESFVDFVMSAADKISQKNAAEALGDTREQLRSVLENQTVQAQALSIMGSYSTDRIQEIGHYANQLASLKPEVFNTMSLPAIYERINDAIDRGVLGRASQPQQDQPSTPPVAAAERTRDFAAEQAQMTTEQSYAPSGARPDQQRPASSYDEAIERSFAELNVGL